MPEHPRRRSRTVGFVLLAVALLALAFVVAAVVFDWGISALIPGLVRGASFVGALVQLSGPDSFLRWRPEGQPAEDHS